MTKKKGLKQFLFPGSGKIGSPEVTRYKPRTMEGIHGIGIQVVEYSKVSALIDKWGDRPLKKVFSETELKVCATKPDRIKSLAAVYAGKTAIIKAFGSIPTGTQLIEVEVIPKKNGKYSIYIDGFFKRYIHRINIEDIHLSISNSSLFTTAYAVVE